MATIPLEEIAPGATVRFTVIDGVQYLSIRDFIMHMCDKDNNQAGEIWRRLPDDKKNEVQAFCVNFQFPGRGQQNQPVITFPGAIKLAMFLPGENAKKNRSLMSQILIRYFAGDPSLIQEIEANAQSDAPVAQMARASLAANENENAISNSRKRTFEALEIEERKLAIEERKQALELGRVNMSIQIMHQYLGLCASQEGLDERARLLLKDHLLNFIARPGSQVVQAIACDDSVSPAPSVGFLTISTVATEMGHKFDSSQLKRLGGRIAQAYFRKYNEPPPKHEQFVDGAVRRVNTYQAKDRALITSEIAVFVAERNL